MTIHEYYRRGLRRKKIVFYEEEPPEEATTYLRGHELCRFNEIELVDSKKLTDVAAVIFRQRTLQPRKITHDLKQLAETLLWHDCRVFVETAPGRRDLSVLFFMRHYVIQAIKDEKLPAIGLSKDEANSLELSAGNAKLFLPAIRVCDQLEVWSSVAEDLQDYPPGVSPFLGLEIEFFDGNNVINETSREKTILIQRAFYDCQKVKLIRNSDGLSGIDTYRVYATPRDNLVNFALPYEYFVKIGDRRKISKEYSAYCDNALEHIPFHLGPRLRLDRCALGTQQGIIVSDYVSGSEKLSNCARDGRAVPIIANLFNTTLRALQDCCRKAEKPLQVYLNDRMPNKIPEHRRPLIKDYENLKKPSELRALLDTIPLKPVLVGVIHGDLHALNVLVRGGDAIVIDFEKVDNDLPLLLDLASLEAGLFIEGFVGDTRTREDLLMSVGALYEVVALVDFDISPCDPSDGSAWFFDCVRQIRMQARQIELANGQYALTVAVELAKKACNEKVFNCQGEIDDEKLTREELRASAYILSERILVKLSN